MRILYFSDNYAHNVMGTKRSIMEELERRKHTVIYQHRSKLPDILKLIKTYEVDQVWLAHSFALLSPEIKKKAGVPIVGFGFSDPNRFSPMRLSGYSVYITNHYATYAKYKDRLPVHYNPSACDLGFHKKLDVEKDIDISFIGLAEHPHLKNKRSRIDIIKRLQRETDFNIQVWGQGWKNGKIEGQEFLSVINRSRIGLDIQDAGSPLSHRMFEYSACGAPIIVRNRPEVERVFKPGEEILVYDRYEDLRDKVSWYLNSPEDLEQIGLNALEKCAKKHDIRHRVRDILKFLDKEFTEGGSDE